MDIRPVKISHSGSKNKLH